MDKKERRECVRIDYSSSVTYEAYSDFGAESPDRSDSREAALVDLSESGLCLIAPEAIRDKQVVKVNLPLSGVSMKIPTLAMAVWQKPYKDGYKVGMMFVV